MAAIRTAIGRPVWTTVTLSKPPGYSAQPSLLRVRNLHSSTPVSHPDDPDSYAQESEADLSERTSYSRLLASRINCHATPTIPTEVYEMTFARSSGPGGQNVNKLNTKAVLRFLLSKAADGRVANAVGENSSIPLPVPKSVVSWVAARSPHYTAATHSILLSASRERSQAENKRIVLDKLLAHLQEVIGEGLRGETSQASLDNLAANKRKFDAKRKKEKMASKAKTSRRRGGDF